MRAVRKIINPTVILLIAFMMLGIWIVLPLESFYKIRPGASFTYALDDAYIHMAIAKNLAQHGVWGVTPDGFSSSASSLLWPILLAGIYGVMGPNELVPLVLNILFAGLAVFFGWRLLRQVGVNHPLLLLLGLVGMIFLTPLTAMVLTGMETSLQICLMLAFADSAVAVLTAPSSHSTTRANAWLLVTGFLFSATRYEDLAFIGLVCLFLLFRRRIKLAFALGAAALFPLVVYGFISVANGWYFLPNSVLVKSVNTAQGWRAPLSVLWQRWRQLLLIAYLGHLLTLLVTGGLSLLVELKWRVSKPGARWLVGMMIPVLLAQALLGQLGWFYRYEAYVVALGVIALTALWSGWVIHFFQTFKTGFTWSGSFQFFLVIAFVLVGYSPVPFSNRVYGRASQAYSEIPGAMANIYDQQIHMAKFIKQYYSKDCVAINDIGAISYFSDVCVIDLSGLATLSTAQAAINHEPLLPVLQKLCQSKQVRLAVVYVNWFTNSLPANWVSAGSWTLDQRVVAGGETVTFFAMDPSSTNLLRQQLIDFAPQLPRGEAWEVH